MVLSRSRLALGIRVWNPSLPDGQSSHWRRFLPSSPVVSRIRSDEDTHAFDRKVGRSDPAQIELTHVWHIESPGERSLRSALIPDDELDALAVVDVDPVRAAFQLHDAVNGIGIGGCAVLIRIVALQAVQRRGRR